MNYFALPITKQKHPPPVIDPMDVLRIISGHLGVSVDRVLSKDRHREVSIPRQIVMWFLRREYGYNLKEVAGILNVNHTSVILACRHIDGEIEIYDDMKQTIDHLRNQISSLSK